jgi:hypothetical protein
MAVRAGHGAGSAHSSGPKTMRIDRHTTGRDGDGGALALLAAIGLLVVVGLVAVALDRLTPLVPPTPRLAAMALL